MHITPVPPPSTPAVGDRYVDSRNGHHYVFDGEKWEDLGPYPEYLDWLAKTFPQQVKGGK